MPLQLIVAEKPSVARDLARVLGVRAEGRSRSAFEGPDRVITFCVGHLVELDEPASYDARWKAWRLDTLPMVPQRFRLRGVKSTRDQLAAVKQMLRDGRFSEVVNACDAGREGELIFRYVYELAGSRLPVRRLWISSLTDEAIRRGFDNLRPGREYDPLADAARCRSEADWLVGMNATRAVTVSRRSGNRAESTLYSIGRVQTPTLALVVARDRAIKEFVPRRYWEVRGKLSTAPAGDAATFEATWRHQRRARLGSEPLSRQLLDRLAPLASADAVHGPVVEKVKQKKLREPPPLLFDLTTLQRTANRRFGFSAARTLEVAQALYESHKVLTYPRTNSRYLSRDLAATMPKLWSSLAVVPEYAPFVQPIAELPVPAGNRRIFDDAKVEDHHAIIPTGKRMDPRSLPADERRLFDLVVRRFLGVFHPDAEFAATELVVRVGPPEAGGRPSSPAPEPPRTTGPAGPAAEEDDTILEALPPPPDRFYARGRVRLVAGWQDVAGFGDDAADGPALPPISEGQRLSGQFYASAKETRPPPRHSEATLLAAMETAGRNIEEEELRVAMKDVGLGTPATRAATIETLIKRGFVIRKAKTLEATPTGIALIEGLPVPSLASAELTGSWEARLSRVARGQETRAEFMRDIVGYVGEVIAAVRGGPPPTPAPSSLVSPSSSASASSSASPARPSTRPRPAAPTKPEVPALTCPRCKSGSLMAGKRGWGCSRWREGCGFVVWFELAGRRLSDAQLRELCEKGKTRKGRWPQPEGPVAGRLVLDPHAPPERGAARFERA